MTTIHDEKNGSNSSPTIEHTEIYQSEEMKIKVENIPDGDDALTVLHTHYEPYTKDEEKRLLRKIDLRLALLMLVVNGLQFVDKLVR